jgi:hypothetical protein
MMRKTNALRAGTELQITVILISSLDQRAMSTPVAGWEFVSKWVY